MNNLQTNALFNIHAGKLNEFKALAAQAMDTVKAKDKNTLQYDWFFNDDHTECMVRERYTDSNAAFEHLANMGELFGKILQVSDLSLEVYGTPSEELKKAITDRNAKLYTSYPG